MAALSSSAVTRHGGYQILNQFMVDPERHAVISLPADTHAGDLLRIRPLRLNADEYLVLQTQKMSPSGQERSASGENDSEPSRPHLM